MANNQIPKFIDVTKTYLPTDPQSFMENLMLGAGESSPENKVPVMAYYGKNFLPTSYGYKSYFGINQKVNIDDLAQRCDFIFIFQNKQFDNVLIALCDTGIWIKKGTTSGAWIQAKTYVPDPNPAVHRDWTYTVASNDLYCYQQGRGEYQKISSLLADPGVALVDVVPTFLNMAGQMGIFKASGRLGFWDSENSVSWSSLDNYQDFTPSLTTLAGFSIFLAVKGRIVTIQSHGDGWMIYSTKSIVYISPESTQQYQWQPYEVLNNSGIAYSRQVTAATPDSIHFAWTSTGLYKIEKAKPELIVPNVTDFIKENNIPVYLKVLEGRYLFIEILDPDFLAGQVNFSEGQVDELWYHFPGTSGTLLDAVAESTLKGTSICQAIHNFGNFADQVPARPGDMKPGTEFTPTYTCYLSNRAPKDVGNIVWTNTPCAATDVNGVALNMNPSGTGNRLDGMTTNATNKTAVTGPQAYIDGKWTMERFVAAQTALWELEEKVLGDYINTISNRASFTDKTTEAVSCVPAETATECTIGIYATKYSAPQFGFNKCSFWLTRYAIAGTMVKNRRAYKKVCNPISAATEAPLSISYASNGACPGVGPFYSSQASLCASFGKPYVLNAAGNSACQCCPNPIPDGNCTGVLVGCPTCRASALYTGASAPGPSFNLQCNYQAGFSVYESVACYNKAVEIDVVPTPETAYCVLSGFDYTRNDNTTGNIAAGACSDTTRYQQSDNKDPSIRPATKDGQFCSIPFTPVTIPGTPAVVYDWPDQDLVIPGGSFLLQAGSAAPVYPTKFGALVYDLQLKKWGNLQQTYKELVDYSPINNTGNGVVDYSSFGMKGGLLTLAGTVRLFDEAPIDSYIVYGKLGYNRLGYTDVEEVRVDFRKLSTGRVTVMPSDDGRNLAAGWETYTDFADALQVIHYGGNSGRWHDLKISGIYDFNYIEFRALGQGKR